MFAGKKQAQKEDYQLDISTAIELSTTIRKSGYLVKRAVESGINWKKRYFVLNDHTVTYYKDYKHTAVARGDLLLMPTTTTKDFVKDNKNLYGFTVTTAFKELRLLANDEQERQEWKEAIHAAVQDLSKSMRGYLYKRAGFLDAWKRKFFVLHRDALTYHHDHNHTAKIEGAIQLTHTTVLELSQNLTLGLMDIVTKRRILVLKADTEEVRRKWERCISAAIVRLQQTDDRLGASNAGTERILRQGTVLAKGFKTEDAWDECYIVLTPSKLYQYEEESSVEPTSVYTVNTSCSVFETNLRRYAFQFVTADRVLHACSTSTYETAEWVRLIRDAILNSVMDDTDPLLIAALKREDQYYEATFREHKPLGIVLERAGEWAVVRVSNAEETGVFRGSALTSINSRPVILNNYMDTIRELSGWKPPLTLGFRKSPTKRGWLTKQARARRKNIKNWKPRYFVLNGGRLTYYNGDQPGAELRGDIQLMGSVVSLMSHAESGQHFTFKLVSGVTTLVMQALTVEDMMDWASTLFHAIAIANGGGYLLDKEKRKQAFLAESQDVRRTMVDKTRTHLSVRLERKSLLDLRLEAANDAYVKIKAERERADSALTRLKQEHHARPSEQTVAILEAAEADLAKKREREQNAFREKLATFQEADTERKEAVRLQQTLEEHEALLAEEEFIREQERLSMERRIADTDQIQEALDADKQVRLQAMIEAELENMRNREAMDELRMSIRGWVDMEEDVEGEEPIPMDEEERFSVRIDPMRNSILSDSESDSDDDEPFISVKPFQTTSVEHAEQPAPTADQPAEDMDTLLPIINHAVVFGAQGVAAHPQANDAHDHFTFTPVHSNRQSSRSLGSVSVDEVKDEPAHVRTETVNVFEAETAILATTPPPMAAIKVRSFRVDPVQPGEHATAIATSYQQPVPFQATVASTSRLEPPVAMVASKHALSSAAVTFQELRRRPVSMRSEESDVLHELLMRGSIDSSSTGGVYVDSDYEAGDEGDGRRQDWQGLPSPSSAASIPNSIISTDTPFEIVRHHSLSSSAEHTNMRPEVCRSIESGAVTDSADTAEGATLISSRAHIPSDGGDVEDNLDAISEIASEVYTLLDPSAEQPWANNPAVKRNSKPNHRTTRGSSSARNSRHSRLQDDDSTEDDSDRTPHERKSRREHRTSGTRINSFRDAIAPPKLITSMLQEESDRGNDGDVSEIYRLESPSKPLVRETKHISSASAVEYDSPSSSDKSSLATSPRRALPTPPTGLAWKLDENNQAPGKNQRPISQQLNTSNAWKELKRHHARHVKNAESLGSIEEPTDVTEEMMTRVYGTLAISDNGELHLLPVTFSNMLRSVTGEQNLFKEMELFHLFDRNNLGRLTIFDFTEGIRTLESTGRHGKELALRIKRFIRETSEMM